MTRHTKTSGRRSGVTRPSGTTDRYARSGKSLSLAIFINEKKDSSKRNANGKHARY